MSLTNTINVNDYLPSPSKNKRHFMVKCCHCQSVKLHDIMSDEYKVLLTTVIKKVPYVCSDQCEKEYKKTQKPIDLKQYDEQMTDLEQLLFPPNGEKPNN